MKKWTYYCGDIREVEIDVHKDGLFTGFTCNGTGVVWKPTAVLDHGYYDTKAQAISGYMAQWREKIIELMVVQVFLYGQLNNTKESIERFQNLMTEHGS